MMNLSGTTTRHWLSLFCAGTFWAAAITPVRSQCPIAPTPIVKPSLPASAKPTPLLPQPISPFLESAVTQPERDLSTLRERQSLLTAIDHSLRYLQTGQAIAAYRLSPTPGITRERVIRSLKRFRQLLLTVKSATALQTAIEREFAFYQAIGKDGQGTVDFTGYFEPVYTASRRPTADFRYPLFRLPPDLARWSKPHPTRLQLEGADGLQFHNHWLKGLELVWLRDRLEAFLIQVQGSARLQLTDGSVMTVGHAGTTDYPYTGVGRELVKAGKFKLEDLTLPLLIQYLEDNPADRDLYLPRNNRFVFFKQTGGASAIGSLGVPVTAERSIATDKTQFPPGALALIQTQLPVVDATGQLTKRPVNHYVLDQDTGGAIKGAGRVDLFMGTGKLAGDRAGLINDSGCLYYLLLK
ncbi:MAG: murein transglycosylase A [Leptolyngbya sp. BL-A-14]